MEDIRKEESYYMLKGYSKKRTPSCEKARYMLEPFVIDMEVFPVVIMVYFGDNESKIRKALADSGIEDKELREVIYEPSREGNTYLFKDGQILIWVYDDDMTPHNFCTIIHEADHAIDYMMELLSIPRDGSTSEVHAYGLEYVISCIMNQLSISLSCNEKTCEPIPSVGEKHGSSTLRDFMRNLWL